MKKTTTTLRNVHYEMTIHHPTPQGTLHETRLAEFFLSSYVGNIYFCGRFLYMAVLCCSFLKYILDSVLGDCLFFSCWLNQPQGNPISRLISRLIESKIDADSLYYTLYECIYFLYWGNPAACRIVQAVVKLNLRRLNTCVEKRWARWSFIAFKWDYQNHLLRDQVGAESGRARSMVITFLGCLVLK